MYKNIIKRLLDFICSLLMIILLSPVLLVLIVLGYFFMAGNPFFVQERPGKNEKVFKLIKFRSMSNRKDAKGELLPDDVRLNKYGKILRATSLDELPELINILKGDMSFVGPRPLLVQYLPLYNEEQKHRHDVLPGLTGYAQAHGRNAVTWENKFAMDVWYAEHVSFALDFKILIDTVKSVLIREGITGENVSTVTYFTGTKEGDEVTWKAPY